MPDFSQLLRDNPFAGDDGSLKKELAQAFDQPDHLRFEAVIAALGRIVIPVMPHERPAIDGGRVVEHALARSVTPGDSDDGLYEIDFPGDRTAYPIFSSAQALAEFEPGARPVLASVSSIAQVAVKHGQGLLVLDPGLATQQWLGRSAVIALAAESGSEWLAPWNDDHIAEEVHNSLPRMLPGFDHISLEPGEYGAVRVIVHIVAGTPRPKVLDAVNTIAMVLTQNEYVRARLDVVEIRPFFAGA